MKCEEKFLEFVHTHIQLNDEITKGGIKNVAIVYNNQTQYELNRNEVYAINLREDTKSIINELKGQLKMSTENKKVLKLKCQKNIEKINEIKAILLAYKFYIKFNIEKILNMTLIIIFHLNGMPEILASTIILYIYK